MYKTQNIPVAAAVVENASKPMLVQFDPIHWKLPKRKGPSR